MSHGISRERLAEMVIETLDAQRAYFRARKKGLTGATELEASKRLERELRLEAAVITAPPRLFDQEDSPP